MLTQNQEKYLQTIPEDKKIVIQPFDPKVKETAQEIIGQIERELPKLQISFGGASALEIAGQNDIDLNLLSALAEYSLYLPGLVKLFGQPTKQNPSLVQWEFVRNGFDVELYLTDRNSPELQRQIRTFEIIRDNPAYKAEYEELKLSSDGQSFREYMRRKYEFFNKILDEK